MAKSLIEEFHPMLNELGVKIDFVFARGDRDDVSGELLNDALKKNGVKALGITRKIGLKDRALGRGDAEIAIDGDWWDDASEEEQRALLDHELTHLVPTGDCDDLRRPIIKLRPHDHEFGWFREVAARHGAHSQERIQARKMMELSGQYFWPSMYEAEASAGRMRNLELTGKA